MLISLLMTLACAPSVTPVAVGASFVQQEKPIVDKRPEVKELLERLKECTSKRGERDLEAIELIGKLTSEFPTSGPKDRAAIAQGFGKCFERTRKPLEGGLPDNRLYIPAAKSLGGMGKNATKILSKWIDNKKHRKNLVLQRELILSLGKTKDVAAVKVLSDLLKYKEDSVIAWAAEALAEFGEAPLKTRKDVFNELLKLLMTTKTLRDSNGNDVIARKRYDAIAAPINTTLQVLSGQSITRPEDWQKWWNKNKKADWDKDA